MSTSPSPTPENARLIRDAVASILRAIGEDPEREGLVKTPERVERAWGVIAGGYAKDPREVLQSAVFHEDCNDMVLVREIELFSVCEHHLLPFFGKCHVAYLPAGKIVGLSKIPRVVDVFARRLQVQERLTVQIA
jgi:GTP cyclohydrolase I